MNRLEQILANALKLKEQADELAKQELSGLTEEVEDLITERLLEGKNSAGQPIRPEYASEAYAAFKRRINPNSERGFNTPDLRLTGTFYRSIDVKAGQEGLIADSSDPKSVYLRAKYGKVLGLDKKRKLELKERLVSRLKPEFLSKLQSK